jgi:hypothetical protein
MGHGRVSISARKFFNFENFENLEAEIEPLEPRFQI